jgi:hypothetical protein
MTVITNAHTANRMMKRRTKSTSSAPLFASFMRRNAAQDTALKTTRARRKKYSFSGASTSFRMNSKNLTADIDSCVKVSAIFPGLTVMGVGEGVCAWLCLAPALNARNRVKRIAVSLVLITQPRTRY